MRIVTFLEVGMENFGPYIDPMILNFQNDCLTLMTGPNGIGKTMALEALPFTLYGVTNKGAKGDDVVNEIVGNKCHTWTKFTIDSDRYEVNRYHKYSKFGGNTVILKKNGVDIKKGSREVIPEIERILCPKKSFENTLMFGQKVKDFFTDLIDSDKKEIFRKILALDNYTLYYRKADELSKEASEAIDEFRISKEVNKSLIQNLKIEIELLEEEKVKFQSDKEKDILNLKQAISENERLIDGWEKSREEHMQRDHNVKEIEEEINKYKTQLELVKQSYDTKHSKLLNQKTQKLSELEKSASELTNGILTEHKVKAKEINEKSGAESDEIRNTIHQLEIKASSLKEERSGHASTIIMMNKDKDTFEEAISTEESVCPTCLQDINENHKEHLRDEIRHIDVERASIGGKINTIEVDLEELRTFKLEPELKNLDGVNERYKKELDGIDKITDKKLEESDKRLGAAKHKLGMLFEEEVSKLDSEIQNEKDSTEDKLDELDTEKKQREVVLEFINESVKAIDGLKSDIVSIQSKIKDLEDIEYDETKLNGYIIKLAALNSKLDEQNKETEELDHRVKILDFWKSAFSSSGIPSMLIDEAIPFMNKTVSDYLENMTNGRYIVSFDTLATTKAGEFRDKISVHVVDTHTKATSRIKLSGGQTRIIDIATILTLGDLQSNIQDISFNILFFDEIFDSLDEENIGFVSKVLTRLKLGRSIYLISHRHEDQLEADEVLVLN